MSKINCNGKKRVEKANKGINVEKIIIDFKKLKLKKKRGKKKGELHRTAKAQHRGNAL